MAKAIIIDGGILLRGVLKFILETGGHSVLGMAEKREDALKLYEKFHADIVFCDLASKEFDGLDLIREILGRDPRARIIAMAAAGNDGRIEEALNAGAAASVDKPFGVVNVAQAIEDALKKR